MKLIFLCGSLEPGVDGVGDYTRRLATELIKQGHQIAALALDDQFTDKPIDHIEIADTIELPVYRIPSKLSADKRFKLADEWIENFNPEWLSLQFVPFSFNAKGLPFGLSTQLSKFKGRKWHIMFHELWIGMEEGSTLKRIIWGKVQKFLIKKLIKKLNPSSMHTQTKLYQIQLAKLGFKVDYLPLFSNIPKIDTINTEEHQINNKITFVNFGTIHPGASIKRFAQEASIYSKSTSTKIDLILIGRCGAEQEHWINEWKSTGLNITVLGEQPIKRVSEVFSKATFGITTTALPLVEKSGSVAAMHEHNLSVICISKPWQPKGINELPTAAGILSYNNTNFESCITSKVEVAAVRVSNIANQCIKNLIDKS
ncbi:MAG: glycosyltransferase family 1 protein [Sphingobacteriaceae bacterium]|nr:MAG: glycosyltransferase family 1 protein [Sphingobacteriaceae bacterium]